MALAITVGKVGALYMGTASPSAFSNLAMSEVNLSAEGRPRYSVYAVTAVADRYLDEDTAVVFQQDQGTGSWITLTPSKIEYPGGRIYLSTPLSSGVSVRAQSGKKYTMYMVQGITDFRLSRRWNSTKKMFLRDTADRTVLLQKAWDATANMCVVKTCAELTTNLTGSNNDVTYVHEPGGTGGNDYTVTYVNPGTPSQSLSISISGTDITVNLATNGSSVIISTANDIITLWGTNALLRGVVSAGRKSGEDGTGVVTAMTETALSGGLDPANYIDYDTKIVAVFYTDYDNDRRVEDFAVITQGSVETDPNDASKGTIRFESWGGPNAGPFERY